MPEEVFAGVQVIPGRHRADLRPNSARTMHQQEIDHYEGHSQTNSVTQKRCRRGAIRRHGRPVAVRPVAVRPVGLQTDSVRV